MSDSHNDDDERAVRQALEAIARASASGAGVAGNRDTIGDLRRALLACPQKSAVQINESVDVKGGDLHQLSPGREGKEAFFDWLKSTRRLTEGELSLARRVRLFDEDAQGRLSLRARRISEARAAGIIGVTCLVAGLWCGWVLFSDRDGLQQVINSFLCGALIGRIAGYVWDQSIRFERLRSKITDIAPWLDEGRASAVKF